LLNQNSFLFALKINGTGVNVIAEGRRHLSAIIPLLNITNGLLVRSIHQCGEIAKVHPHRAACCTFDVLSWTVKRVCHIG